MQNENGGLTPKGWQTQKIKVGPSPEKKMMIMMCTSQDFYLGKERFN